MTLGGFFQFPWAFSAYLLTAAVPVPVYGELADLLGRAPSLLFGIGLFVLGSLLRGFAWSHRGVPVAFGPVLPRFVFTQRVMAGEALESPVRCSSVVW